MELDEATDDSPLTPPASRLALFDVRGGFSRLGRFTPRGAHGLFDGTPRVSHRAVTGGLLPALRRAADGWGARRRVGRPVGGVTVSEATAAEAGSALAPTAPVSEGLPLAALFPDCFDWERPRPVKTNIHQDLIRLGYDKARVRRALDGYCRRRRYRSSVRAGAMRVDLQGRPAGAVTAQEAERARLARPPKAGRSVQAMRPPPETPLPKAHLVPGRLEWTVTFSELPKTCRQSGSVTITLQTSEGVVTARLPANIWRRLEHAAKDHPQWVAALRGSLARYQDGEIVLTHLALSVTTPIPASPAGAPAPAAPVAAEPDPTVVRPTLCLKGKGQNAG